MGTPMKARRKIIKEILDKGINSPTRIVEILEEEYGVKTTRQTVYRDLAAIEDTITPEKLDNEKEAVTKSFDKILDVMKSKALAGNTQAAKAYAQIEDTKVKIMARIADIQVTLDKKNRPIHKIVIGEFPEANKENVKNGKSESEKSDN